MNTHAKTDICARAPLPHKLIYKYKKNNDIINMLTFHTTSNKT